MQQGPGDRRNLEEMAQEIINSSDEGLDDLLGGTEVYEDDDFEDGYVPVADDGDNDSGDLFDV